MIDAPEDESGDPDEAEKAEDRRPWGVGKRKWQSILVKLLPEQRRKIIAATKLTGKFMGQFVRDAAMKEVDLVNREAREARNLEDEDKTHRARNKSDIPGWASFEGSASPLAPPTATATATATATPSSTVPPIVDQLMQYVFRSDSGREERARTALDVAASIGGDAAVAALRERLREHLVKTNSPWWHKLTSSPP